MDLRKPKLESVLRKHSRRTERAEAKRANPSLLYPKKPRDIQSRISLPTGDPGLGVTEDEELAVVGLTIETYMDLKALRSETGADSEEWASFKSKLANSAGLYGSSGMGEESITAGIRPVTEECEKLLDRLVNELISEAVFKVFASICEVMSLVLVEFPPAAFALEVAAAASSVIGDGLEVAGDSTESHLVLILDNFTKYCVEGLPSNVPLMIFLDWVVVSATGHEFLAPFEAFEGISLPERWASKKSRGSDLSQLDDFLDSIPDESFDITDLKTRLLASLTIGEALARDTAVREAFTASGLKDPGAGAGFRVSIASASIRPQTLSDCVNIYSDHARSGAEGSVADWVTSCTSWCSEMLDQCDSKSKALVALSGALSLAEAAAIPTIRESYQVAISDAETEARTFMRRLPS